MSGPIVRKYGFPNFDQIFGKRELEHGVDDPEQREEANRPEAPRSTSSDSAAHSEQESRRKPDGV